MHSTRRIGTRLGLVSAAAIALAVGCSGGDGGDPTPTPTPTAAPFRFETHVVPLFYAQCGAADAGCHSRAMFVADSANNCQGYLALEDTALGSVVYSGTNMGMSTGCPDLPLYERLQKLAFQCDQAGENPRAYVTPGVASSSYLFHKIAGGPYCDLTPGTPSAPMPFDSPIDDPDDIDRLRDWINAGAPRVGD